MNTTQIPEGIPVAVSKRLKEGDWALLSGGSIVTYHEDGTTSKIKAECSQGFPQMREMVYVSRKVLDKLVRM